MLSNSRILGTIALLVLAMGLGTPTSVEAAPGKGKGAPKHGSSADTPEFVWHEGPLESIFTEKNGEIINIAIDVAPAANLRTVLTISGCGLNIAQLPHLMTGLDRDTRVQVQSVGGCIGRVNVMMKP